MTPQIATVFGILLVAVLLFVTERLRFDVVALLVLVALAVTGLVTPTEALSGFSNLAVVTVWAVLILSGGLARTGVAGLLGKQVLRLAGSGEARLLVIIMVTVGVLSGFMNDIGVASLFLPVVIDIARRKGQPPSKLLMPLAFASLLGGLNTLIGTPPNILVSEALREAGLPAFRMFDYTPVGVVVMLSGIAYMALVGRRLLPARDITREFRAAGAADLGSLYELHERLLVVHLPEESPLSNKTLAQSRLGSALGLNVIAIVRDGNTQLAPDPDTVLRPGDRMLVGGRLEQLSALGDHHLLVEQEALPVERLASEEIEIAEAGLSPRSNLEGQTLREINFRRRFGVNVLAIWRNGSPHRTNLTDTPLERGDVLLIQGPHDRLESLRNDPNFLVSSVEQAEVYRLHERLIAVSVPSGSNLAGKTLAESRLGDAFGLTVLGVVREGTTQLMPEPDAVLQVGDTLLVEGDPDDLSTLRGLQELEIDQPTQLDLEELESEQVGMVDVVLSPYSTLAGKSLRELNFRERYGLSVLAVWRGGRAHRTNLRDMPLRLGDALLLHGPRERLQLLGTDPEFLVLTEAAQEPPRLKKAPIAAAIMGLVLLSVIVGWLPIAIAAVMGVVLMIVTRCLTIEEAHRNIEWKAVFLIAGMLPLGIAMEQTGAARLLAEGMVGAIGGLGPLAVAAGLFILAALASQVMPNPAVAVLLAPVALNTAADLDVSPFPLMMAIAVSASAAFLSPVGHPANVLIMGPGGYRFSDYIKVGLPLTLVVLVAFLLVVPIFWPF
jgi:di/tricarboxylate transporter